MLRPKSCDTPRWSYAKPHIVMARSYVDSNFKKEICTLFLRCILDLNQSQELKDNAMRHYIVNARICDHSETNRICVNK